MAASTCSVSVAVIAFEMTGQISNMMPVLLAVLVASHVGRIVSVSAYQDLAAVSHLKKDPMLQPVALFNRVVRDAMRPLVGGDAKRAHAAAVQREAAEEEAAEAAARTATRARARLFALEAGDADDDTKPLAAVDTDSSGDVSALHGAAAATSAAAVRARRYSAFGDTAYKPDDDAQPATVVSRVLSRAELANAVAEALCYGEEHIAVVEDAESFLFHGSAKLADICHLLQDFSVWAAAAARAAEEEAVGARREESGGSSAGDG